MTCASVVEAPRCGVETKLGVPNSGEALAGSSTNTSSAAPPIWPESSPALSAASSISPPRAQLMIRTPFLVLARFSAEEDVARLVGERGVQRDEVAAGEQLVELDLLDADILGALGGEEGIVGDDLHLEPERAVGDDPSRCFRRRSDRASCW